MHLRHLLLAPLLACGASPADTTTLETTGPTTGDGLSETGAPTGSTSGATSYLPPPATTTGTTGSTTDPGTTADGTTFIPFPPDVPTECDIFDPQSCPEGHKCTWYASDGGNAWNATKCAPVAGDPAQPGEPCVAEGSGTSGLDDCAAGSMCFSVDAELAGHCVAFCQGSPENLLCDDPDTLCVGSGDGLSLCLEKCNPLDDPCAQPGDLCIPDPSGNGFVCVLDSSGEAGAVHDGCNFANACDPGLGCLPPDASDGCDPQDQGCCLPFCDTAVDPNPLCAPEHDEVCVPFYEEGTAPAGYEQVGVCAIPL
jgi:hypothetical protein